MRALAILEVGIRDFRNVEQLDCAFVEGLNVIHGDNGHGKTSLLEAVYLAASSKSFRTAKLAEAVRHEQRTSSVRLRVRERSPAGPALDLDWEQSAGLTGGRVLLRLDGQRPASRFRFATRTPMVVFHPDELDLSAGPATLRRRLLDRLVLYRDPLGSEALGRYGQALRARQDLLRRGVRSGSALDAYEALCAEEGARLTRARAAAAGAFGPPLAEAFVRIAEPGLQLTLRYAHAGAEDPAPARERLANERERDAHRASAGFGPHRDDLELRLGGHLARAVASQGQHRALVLSMKAAESAVVAAATGLVPILLLDDVSSELDPHRTEALFAFLGAALLPAVAARQIILTTTRPSLVPATLVAGGTRRDFHLVRGRLIQAP